MHWITHIAWKVLVEQHQSNVLDLKMWSLQFVKKAQNGIWIPAKGDGKLQSQ